MLCRGSEFERNFSLPASFYLDPDRFRIAAQLALPLVVDFVLGAVCGGFLVDFAQLAAGTLLVGWMAVAIIGSSINEEESPTDFDWKLNDNFFKIIAGLLILLLAFSLGNTAFQWIPASFAVISGGLVLAGLGLLQLGLSTQPFRTTIGLLTLLSGFDIIYAAVVNSVLVAGLSALVSLGLAFLGAYLMNVEHLEDQP